MFNKKAIKPKQIKLTYDQYLMSKFWLMGLLFTLLKLGYNLTYISLKYTNIDPSNYQVTLLFQSVDYLYVGLMLANLLILFVLSFAARCSSTACKMLQYWSVIGLFLESFQWFVYVNKI